MSTFTQHLIHAVTFQEQVSSRDSDGVLQITWQNVWLDLETELVDVPAEVLLGPGREFERSGQMQSEVAARIRVPWFPGGIKSSWRILWDDQVFNILGIPDRDATGRREYRIKCGAGVNDGQ